MRRAVEPELLDELPADDPLARGSRRDLRTVNAIMGNAPTVARTLLALHPDTPAKSLVELGAGDGTFALAVATRLGVSAAPRRIVLVDRQPSLDEHTRAAFGALSCRVDVVQADVFDWLNRQETDTADVTIANLFLHHFSDSALAALLRGASRRTRCFLACEPLRSRAAWCAAAMLPLIGCNRVTFHDARISVKAGFKHRELSAVWPEDNRWRLREQRVGLFTHHFVAQHV